MFDQVIPIVGGIFDQLANSDEGHKLIDDASSLIGRMYKNLTEVHGIPSDAAATIIQGVGKSMGTK